VVDPFLFSAVSNVTTYVAATTVSAGAEYWDSPVAVTVLAATSTWPFEKNRYPFPRPPSLVSPRRKLTG